MAPQRGGVRSADSRTAKNEIRDGYDQEPLAFKALVELKNQKLRTGDLVLALAADMELSAEIEQGKRAVLEYLLSPVQRVASEAAGER